MSGEKRRVLLTKSKLDAHDRGVRYVARMFMLAGLEFIYTRYGAGEEIVNTAIAEDVDVIGISFSSSDPTGVTQEVWRFLRERGTDGVRVIIGGLIPDKLKPVLMELSVSGVFGAGSSVEEVIESVKA